MSEQEFAESRDSGRRAGVLVVDDHPIMRQGLVREIDGQPDMAVCGTANGVDDALQQLEATNPALVLIDISLKGMSGIELIKRIHTKLPDLPILVLSMHEETMYAERALRSGARGYLMRNESAEQVVESARQLLAGREFVVSEKMVDRLLRNLVHQPESVVSPLDHLSDRELEVFNLLGHGRGTREIADDLQLSIKTVETHRAHIKQKLHLRHANELVHFASQWVQTQGRQA